MNGLIAAIGIIFLIAIIAVIIWIFWEYNREQEEIQDYLDRGCIPLAENRRGTPTIWRCPQPSG